VGSIIKRSWIFATAVLFLSTILLPVFAAEEADDDRPMIVDNSSTSSSSGNKGGVSEILSRMSQLENEIRQLRGDLELATHDIKQMKTRQRELYNDIDRRLSDMEKRVQGGTSFSAPPVASKKSKKSRKQASVKVPDYSKVDRGERKEYQAAFKLLRDSRYQQAIESFKAYLVKFPKGTFAVNAQYWLAEAHYVSRNFKEAIVEFNKVIKNYPKNSKVTGARIKIGYCYYELKQYAKAKKALKYVIRRYPRSSSAKLARIRLKRMREEGR